MAKRGTAEHPKTADLRSRLGITTPHALGILDQLWKWAGTYARRGNVGRYSDQAIADGVKDEVLVTQPARLVAALVDSGWLDRSDEHRLVIHDWWDHAEDHVHAAVARNREFFVCGRAPKLRKLEAKERAECERFYSENAAHAGARKRRTRRSTAAAAGDVGANGQPSLPSHAMPEPSSSYVVDTTDSEIDSTVGTAGAVDEDTRSALDVENGIWECSTVVDDAAHDPPTGLGAPGGQDALRSKPDPRGSRVPDPLDLDAPCGSAGATYRGEAVRLGIAPDRIEALRDEFVDYWRGIPGARGRKTDWPGTWRNRCRDAPTKYRQRAPSEQRGPSSPPRFAGQQTQDVIRRRLERHEPS